MLLHSKINKEYNAEKASLKYLEWYCSDGDLNLLDDAFEAFLPIINMVVVKKFQRMNDAEREDLYSTGSVVIYETIKSKRYLPTTVGALTGVVYQRCLGALIDFVKWYFKQEIFDYTYENKAFPVYGVEDPAERTMVSQTIPLITKRIRDYFVEVLRFNGREELACSYIMTRYLEGGVVLQDVLTQTYGIPKRKVDFFVKYVAILYRAALYLIVKDEGIGVRSYQSVVNLFNANEVEELYTR